MNFTFRELEGDELDLPRQWAAKRALYVEHNFDPAPSRKQIGYFTDELASVFTVTMMGSDVYRIDVTSPPRTNYYHIVWPAGLILGSLFEDLGAERVIASAPVVNGHRARGSQRLCEAFGLTPCGTVEERVIGGRRYGATVYSVNREQWFSQRMAA